MLHAGQRRSARGAGVRPGRGGDRWSRSIAPTEALALLQEQGGLLREQRRHPRRGRAAPDAGEALPRGRRHAPAGERAAPDDVQIRERLGLALYYDKQYQEAREVLDKADRRDEQYANRTDLLLAYGRVPARDRPAARGPATRSSAPIELEPASAAWLPGPRPGGAGVQRPQACRPVAQEGAVARAEPRASRTC